MAPLSSSFWCFSLLVLITTVTSRLIVANEKTTPPAEFASVYQLDDGEIVTKFRWKNFTVIETKFHDIDLIQMVKNHGEILQFWLSDQILIDCEYTNNNETIEKFWSEFDKINPNIRKDTTRSYKILEEYKNLTTVPEHLKRLTKFERYEKECSQLHEKIRQYYGANKRIRKNAKRRGKRDLLVFPGTKWCGKGSTGKGFEDLGDYSFADRCCRDHDQCRYSIGPFEKQYYLFNYRFHYASHCSCDEKFRACLKVANSGDANLVGKIFFNVVKTQCFMFVMDDVCLKHSWWGSCTKTARRKRAVFRDPLEY